MKKFICKKGNESMTWTYYECNGLRFLESDKGDFVKVRSYIGALRLMITLRQGGWTVTMEEC